MSLLLAFCERCLADSNRRTRFCRPLTKPLIQGTIPLRRCKGTSFISFLQIFWRISFFVSLCCVVGVTRLERATTWSQTRCATNCATPRAQLGNFPEKLCKSSTFCWDGQACAQVFSLLGAAHHFLCKCRCGMFAKMSKFVVVWRLKGLWSVAPASVKPLNSGYSIYGNTTKEVT